MRNDFSMSLDEIPDKVMVSLGKRGFDPVNPKVCPKCGNEDKRGLKLLEKIERETIIHEEGFKQTVDYKIQCLQCDNTFFLRLQHVIQKIGNREKRVTTLVNVLDENLNDLGWLGHF